MGPMRHLTKASTLFLLLGVACTPQGEAEPTADESSTSEGDGDGDGDDEGCEELSEGNGDSPAQIRSCEPHDQNPQLDSEQIDALATGQLQLALDLYDVLRTGSAQDESFTISPYSLQAAFGMLYAGTVEPARSELESTLHFTLGDAQHTAFNWLDGELIARGLPELEDADPVVVAPVNRAWVEQEIVEFIQPNYLDVLSTHYDTGMFLGDFIGQPQAERDVINAWVEAQTNNLIPELFAAGDIDTLTRFVLVNALYLAAPWASPFDPDSTSTQSFTRLDGTTVDVEMMFHEMPGRLDEGDGWQSITVAMRGEELAFTVIMPYDFAAFEASVDAETLAAILTDDEFGWSSVQFSLPRFELHSTHDLDEPLQELGLISPYMDATSFADMADSNAVQLILSAVVQQTVLKVDEGGIEAAAATGIVGQTPPSIPPSFFVDRPFLLAIHDRPTKALLFFGRVLEPQN